MNIRTLITSLILAASTAAALLGIGSASAHVAPRTITIYGKVGPGYSISLRTKAGASVTTLKRNTTYTILVTDASNMHNFHLSGPGFNKKTGISATVTNQRWSLAAKQGTYKYVCDAHPTQMHGSFKVA